MNECFFIHRNCSSVVSCSYHRGNKSVLCSLVATDGIGVYSGVGAVRNEVHHSLKAKAEEVTCVTILCVVMI